MLCLWNRDPCSEQVWSFLYNLQRSKQTITCTYKGEKKQASFLPPIQNQLNNAVDFDFSNTCRNVWKSVETKRLNENYEWTQENYCLESYRQRQRWYGI